MAWIKPITPKPVPPPDIKKRSVTSMKGKFVSGGRCWVWKGPIPPRPATPPAGDCKKVGEK